VAALNQRKAIDYVRQHRVALTFPEQNQKEPPNLWSCFHPRTQMRWEWDGDGDRKVSDLWIFRESLSRSGKILYSKWYRGKATFVDLEFLPTLLSALKMPAAGSWDYPGISPVAREILEALLENSPLSTKQLKKLTGLVGKDFENIYHRALRELWSRLWIVGWGEKDDGAFPSLNIGATQVFFEKEWKKAINLDPKTSREKVETALALNPKVLKFFNQNIKQIG
jgi:hypothetical protein